MTILITGGAGYIGSHAVYEFLDAGYDVAVADDLSTGSRDLLPPHVPFYQVNVGDQHAMGAIFRDHKIDTVLHFAGSIVVPESVENPLKYYQNNSAVSLSLLTQCVQNAVRNFIFSSTASVYGNNKDQLMREDTPTHPENPYASSKLITEMMLRDVANAHGINYAILRYFNVAGADPRGRTGQVKKDATHLIKVACQTALGLRENIHIFGEDYDTHDGTCIRDYIHVSDLANAHLLVYQKMMGGRVNKIYNCGYGRGFSVREVIEAVEKVAGCSLNQLNAPRRAGDPAALIANSELLQKDTGWKPHLNDLELIIESALKWERSQINKG